MNKEMISVIVPIYNVEQYICECIDHIINQTYKNLEIILVDDGSPDNCPRICDDYRNKDSRIKVIHKKNGGLSDARNAGIKAAHGSYLGFVDSDDFPELNMFEELYRSITENNSDMSICGVREFGLNRINRFYGRKVLNQSEFMKALLSGEVESYTWNKLYKRELFDETEFPVGELFEDVKILHLIGEKADKVSFTDSTFYNYRIRENSITGMNKGKKATDFLQATQNRCERYENTEYYVFAAAGKFKCLRVIVSDLAYSGDNSIYKKELFAESKAVFKICKSQFRGFQMLITMLYFFSPKLYAIIKKMYLKS